MIRLPRDAQNWLPGLLAERIRRPSEEKPRTVWLTLADHFEPYWALPGESTAAERVDRWAAEWPHIANSHLDDLGRPAQYTFFYPEEEYRPELLDRLKDIVGTDTADVEVHIHHDGEGEKDFIDRMSRFVEVLDTRHGLLRKQHGQTVFGFIHGNWALDNAHPTGRWCGLNNELTLLKQLGCYADFTLPAAPDPCQTSTVNSIYWAKDDPLQPKSHDKGVRAQFSGGVPEDSLLLVQGPLGIGWRKGFPPQPFLEVGELSGNNPATEARAKVWLDHAPRLGEHQFLKLHGHGAPEKNALPLLQGDLARTLKLIRQECEHRGMKLVHATAWQTYSAISALVRGENPLDPARSVLDP